MITELTEQEYKSTMTGKMVDVTETVEPILDIWPYVEELRDRDAVADYVFTNQLVEFVSENEDGSFHHVVLPAGESNVFVVLVIDVKLQRIKGHFRLDLNEQYGLS